MMLSLITASGGYCDILIFKVTLQKTKVMSGLAHLHMKTRNRRELAHKQI